MEIPQGSYNYGQYDKNPILQERIIKELRNYSEVSRDSLSKIMGVARTTLYDNLIVLERKGIVDKFEYNNDKRGRSIVYRRLV